MTPIARVITVAAVLALAGCGANQTPEFSQGPTLGEAAAPAVDSSALPPDNATATPAPAQMVTTGVAGLDISAFTDPTAFRQLSDSSKAQASSAQYYALQFGRVGAARTWSGDNSMTGSVNVGPFVKVNNHDCRDFTNIVNIGAKSFTKRGTACRGDDGIWAVGSAAAAGPAMGAAPAGTPVNPNLTPTAYPAASGIGAQG